MSNDEDKNEDTEIVTRHESFGCIEISRCSGDVTLFGSRAEHIRNQFHCDDIYAKEELIAVNMSSVQLGEINQNE